MSIININHRYPKPNCYGILVQLYKNISAKEAGMQLTNVRCTKCSGKFSWLLESHPVVNDLCLYGEQLAYSVYAYKHSAQGRDRKQKGEDQ